MSPRLDEASPVLDGKPCRPGPHSRRWSDTHSAAPGLASRRGKRVDQVRKAATRSMYIARTMLGVGDRAPEFSARTTDGKTLSLSELRGRPVVIYFFPHAFTPGCTAETRRFRDNYDDLRALGAEVIGISTDDHEKQCRFAEAEKVKFPLIGDEHAEIQLLYGVKRPILRSNRRVTYVIDEQGMIAAVFHHEFQVLRHMDDVRQFLEKRARSNEPK
jgi:peroxiredoxin